MADTSKISGGVSRKEWLHQHLYSGYNGPRKQWIDDVRRTEDFHQAVPGSEPPRSEFCTRHLGIDRVTIAPNLRFLHLNPEHMAIPAFQQSATQSGLQQICDNHMDCDADKLY